MPRVGIDLEVDALAVLLRGRLELEDAGRRDALVQAGEVAEQRHLQRRDGRRLRDQVAVVDDRSRQGRLGQGELERETPAHAPANRSDLRAVHVEARAQVYDG